MPRASRLVCAWGWFVLGLAGCAASESFSLLLQSTASGRDRMVVGSPQSVSLATQATLNQLGLTAVVQEQAGVIRISSATRTGQRFQLMLTRVENEGTERTRVRIEWEATGDEQMGFQILSQLEAHTRS